MRSRRDPATALRSEVGRVVREDMCSGCGLCAVLDSGLSMELVDGFMRPAENGDPDRDVDAAVARNRLRTFRRSCPGLQVRAGASPGVARHRILGPVAGAWEAYATDPELRHRGSSGGVLSALNSWLVESGAVTEMIGAAGDRREPRRSVPVTIRSREQALEAAGSRYAPVSLLPEHASAGSGAGLCGKPCEASALRAARGTDPIILSFFCAGTPSQDATDGLVAQLGFPREEHLDELWYRGRGWPGEFTAVSTRGARVSTTYSESWGAALGPTVQWRCRVCVDGVGESADISCGDYWEADERGYPDFEERPGRSVLIARTPRGVALVGEAARAGVIHVGPVNPDHVAEMQPYQTSRRRYLLGRLAGTRLLMGQVPRYRGFGLARFLVRSPRRTWHEFRGTVTRISQRNRRRAGDSASLGRQDHDRGGTGT